MAGKIMSISRLAAWVATVVRCLVEREKRGGHRKKLQRPVRENSEYCHKKHNRER